MSASAATTCYASLLSYLQDGGSNVRPVLSLVPSLPGYQERDYPFRVLDDTDATSRLVAAEFVTDSGALLKKIVLRIQKDQYSFQASVSTTNDAVDADWQDAFLQRYHGARGPDGPLFSVQVTALGGAARLSSLFYCRERRLFFHPVCPSCGSALELCTDDLLLNRAGLHPYTTSLKRYLSCRSCTANDRHEFYTYEREATDPVTMRDRWSLIDRFRFVTEAATESGAFPCIGCAEWESCYGIDQNARLRIVPFAFYPFYLITYDEVPRQSQDNLLTSEAEQRDGRPVPQPPVPHVPSVDPDALVRSVLEKLIDRYRGETPAPQPPPPVVDEDEVATVILVPRQPEVTTPLTDDDMVTETVVLTTDMLAHRTLPPRAAESPEDGLGETVVITGQWRGESAVSPHEVASGDSALDETVCVRPPRKPLWPEHQSAVELRPEPGPPPAVSAGSEDDELGETIVIMPRRGKPCQGGRR